MKRALSVSAIKRRKVPGISPSPVIPSDVLRRSDSFGMSRRQALGLAGVLSLAAAPMASALESALSATYTIHRRGKRIVFRVAGVDRWVIDPRHFDGTPGLKFSETDEEISLVLTGAFFPGTTIPADIEARITKGNEPKLTCKLSKIGSSFSLPFVPWLLERSSSVAETSKAIRWVVGNADIAIPGNTDVLLRPTWTIDLRGPIAMRLGTNGVKTIMGTRLEVQLPEPKGPTYLVPAPSAHTIARLHRGGHNWDVPLDLTATETFSVSALEDTFDTCTIESASDTRTCVSFEGANEGRAVLLASAHGVRLPLRDIRYAWTENEQGIHEAFVARYSERPTWTIVDGVGLELGDRSGMPPLEIERRNGELVRCVVAPALHRYNLPIDGAVTEATRPDPRTQLALVSPDVPTSALPKQHLHLAALVLGEPKNLSVQQGAVFGQGATKKSRYKVKQDNKNRFKFKLVLAKNPSITVIRPDDLLVLNFEFDGMTINKAGGSFSAGSQGKLIVHFQPQHIAERAFFYVSDDEPETDDMPDSSGKGNIDSGNEPRVEPPIDSVMAGPSRLVFTAKNGHVGRYTMEGLLDWSNYELRVSPSAKPPPPKFTYGKLGGSFIGKYLSKPDSNPNNQQIMAIRTKDGKRKQRKAPAKRTPTKMNSSLVAKLPSASRASTQKSIEASSDFTNALPKSMIDDYVAQITGNPKIRIPTDTETVIEYPYRMMLSPNKYAAWAHSLGAKTNEENGRTELWHTRLGVRHSDGSVNEEAAYFRTVRAIWSPDIGTSYTMPEKFRERPFRNSINRRDRHEIVQLTSNYGMTTEDEPIDVKRMMLTSMGAWADMTGAWDPFGVDKLDVEQWIQRGTQGRDHFVRVCYKGYLFPFGNKATLVKETERKFRRTPRGDMAAYLMQRMYIILREPVREFPADGVAGIKYKGRGTPFRRITITTKVTPNLRNPGESVLDPGEVSPNTFWPRFQDNGGPADVVWSCIGRDWDNNDVQFSTPLAFIANSDATAGNSIEDWITNTYRTGETNRRTIDMEGQSISFAPSSKMGDTTLPTQEFKLTGYFSSSVAFNTPRFFPAMESSLVRIEKVNELLGTDGTQKVEYFLPFLKYAFEKGQTVGKGAPVNLDSLKNTSQIFLSLANQMGMNFNSQSDKSGGMAAPSITIGALSRAMGPVPGDFKIVADIEDEAQALLEMKDKVENAAIAAGNFDPMEYFEDLLTSKILGDITLQDVLDFVQDVMSNADSMPGLDKKDDFGVSDVIDKTLSKSEIASNLADKVNSNEAVRAAAQKLDPYLAQINSEVEAAKDLLEAEIDSVKSEMEAVKQEVLNEVAGAKKKLDNYVREWKKRVEDKVNVLKSEIDKAVQPLKEAGNEVYKKYTEASEALETLKKGLSLVYEWQTEIKKTPGDLLVPMYPGTTDKEKKATLYLKAEIKKKLNLDPPEINLYGSVSNFIVNLIGTGAAQFIIIKFNGVSLSAKVGEKPSIDPDIEEVAFAGPLTFVNKLKDLIPSGGGAGGVGFSFGFDVQPSGVTATLTITLPNITVGVFSLMNMSFLMRLKVPFDGTPFSAYFAFCTRENPFRLTIMVFGGGGFFGIEITAQGLRMLEAAFEFGGNFAFDVGVASGGASVMAGVYYKLEKKEVEGKMVDQSELTGYFRLTGNLSILGIIRVSLLFELKLTWQGNGKLFGTVTLEIEIEVLFLSFSVGVTVERQLKGSDGDPTFVDMLPQHSMWEDYCNAFA